MKRLQNILLRTFTISSRELSLFRLIYCTYILVFIGLPAFTWMGDTFNYLYNPPQLSVAHFFNNFPANSFFVLLTSLTIISFAGIFIGIFTRLSSIVFSLCYLLGTTFEYSFGKIDHFLLPYILPTFMALAGWGEHYSVDSKRKAMLVNSQFRSYILALFALTVAFSFFTSGLAKAVDGWWKWDVDALRLHVFRYYFGSGRTALLAEYFISIKSHLFWKASDYAVLVFELGFLFSVLNTKVFRIFCATAIVFHTINYFLLNIPFTGNLIIYLLFVEWKLVGQQVTQWARRITTSPLLSAAASICLLVPLLWWTYLVSAGAKIANSPSLINILLKLVSLRDYSIELIFAVALFVLGILILIHARRRNRHDQWRGSLSKQVAPETQAAS